MLRCHLDTHALAKATLVGPCAPHCTKAIMISELHANIKHNVNHALVDILKRIWVIVKDFSFLTTR